MTLIIYVLFATYFTFSVMQPDSSGSVKLNVLMSILLGWLIGPWMLLNAVSIWARDVLQSSRKK